MNHASITHDIMPGIQFRSPRHANPVIWTVDHYHRNGCYVCEEPTHHTTCEFHYDEIMANLVEEHREPVEPVAEANARAHRETDPVPAIIAHNPVASEIYWQVMSAMQEADEATADLERTDYANLMICIASAAQSRASTSLRSFRPDAQP